jgi:hypothetical protein
VARHLVCGLRLAAIVVALQGCGDASSPTEDRAPDVGAPRATTAPPAREASGVIHAPAPERSAAHDLPPWLAELLQSADPNVRIQALDAWARQPNAALDPLTYALVDPDESVRAHAEELLEQALARH